MDMAARIRASGEPTNGMQGRKLVYKVRCQGCREDIFSDGSLEDVEYVKTKRGSEWFFHRQCAGEVWNRRIV